jgi:DeoR/GlpR family transcriptional regulator of sugar metabolism
MLRDERRRDIEEILRTNGKVEVTKLSRQFDVTETTIRRDLDELVERNIAVRIHGGAMLPGDSVLAERPYELRVMKNRPQKEAIAREAIKLLGDGDRVFFDSSTSVLFLAQLLTNNMNLLVVTDTLAIVNEIFTRSDVQVICLGGEIQKETGSFAGPLAESMLAMMHFDKAFISLPKISRQGILTTSSTHEFRIKQNVINRSKKVILLADSSKLGDPDFLEIGRLSQIDTVITDPDIDPAFITLCQKSNVSVIIAPLE